ncbi:MAG: carbohydrate binding domain-containing protein [bacterium]|nr:carbohydrate binding domain-containing protein [bacterium]MDD5756281.1 carbohydrate binding domain-containing protein [bacterium]
MATILMVQQIFSRPGRVEVPLPEPVVVVEAPKPLPLPVVAPEKPKPPAPPVVEIEKVKIQPKPVPLPPLKKVVPKPEPIPEPVVVSKPVELPKPVPVIRMVMDNFNESSKRNTQGGFTGTFGGTGGFCLESYQKGSSAGAGEDGGNVLKLVYNVNNGYAGYYSKLNSIDLTKYHRLTFNVKGAKGGEVFEIELGDGVIAYKVDIRDFLPYGASTTWQKVSIPLKAFADVKNWKKMKGNFAIVFEQYLGTPTNSTLYVDNITFEE